jgi:hypothetical protein
MRFLRAVRLGMGTAMAGRMGVYARMDALVIANMSINVVSHSVGSMSRAMSEIAQQRGYNEV